MLIKKLARFLSAMVIVVGTICMLTTSFDAEARRMGGGGSFGRQSINVLKNRAPAQAPSATLNRSAPAVNSISAANKAGTAAKPRTGISRFLGPIAGIAAGLGIAALLSSLGIGGALLEFLSSVVLIALVIVAISYVVRRFSSAKQQAAMQGAGNNSYNQFKPQTSNSMQRQARDYSRATSASGADYAASRSAEINPNTTSSGVAAAVDKSWFVPAGFDVNAFLQTAKQQFVLIQSLWDNGDVERLKQYMTDDLAAELTPQITSQSGGNQQTEVVLLNAELLGIEQVHDGHLASVRFSGMLREQVNTAAFRFEEVWNLYKNEQSGWLLAGIQQIPVENQS